MPVAFLGPRHGGAPRQERPLPPVPSILIVDWGGEQIHEAQHNVRYDLRAGKRQQGEESEGFCVGGQDRAL